jgi:tetratricopeptide (TPR) repeat protein
LQVEFVSRLARSLDIELMRAEAERVVRERPDNPDAQDLLMRGLAAINEPWSRQSTDAAANYFERALAIDPNLVPAMVGLANVLADRWGVNPDADSRSDTARAEDLLDRALSRQQGDAWAHNVRADIYSNRRQWAQAIAEAEAAIAYDPNNADAQGKLGYWKVFLGRAEDGFGGIYMALRLSPRDPQVAQWQFERCHLHNHLAQWDQAIEWCKKAVAGDPEWWTLADLAMAYANAGHDKEARQTAAQIEKVSPGFTVQTYAGIKWTDNEVFNHQFQRMVEGLRKAGVPEGEAKTN